MFYTGQVTDAKTGLPLPNIPVSDGRNITRTDSQGRYQLSGWSRSRVIHAGVLTQGHDDWFAYTGGQRGNYDLCLDPVPQQGDFCFFHISDTEVNGRKKLDWVDFLAEKANEFAPAFLINTGDLFAVEGLNRHRKECAPELVGCPVRYTIGNHDYTQGDYGEQLYEQLYGPCWYSFDYGCIHFVALPIGKGDQPSGYTGEDVFTWLKKDLAGMKPGRKLVILDHDCCANEETFVHRIGDAEMALGHYGLIGWIMGHFHTAYDITKNGVHLICSGNPGEGGIDSSAAGVRMVSFRQQQLSSEFLYYRLPLPSPDAHIWRTCLPGRCEFSQPVLYRGDLLVCTVDYGFGKELGIYRICGETGAVRWYFPTENGIKGSICVSEGRIYAQDCVGSLSCLDAADGSLLWQRSLPLNATAYTRMGVFVRDGVVVAGRPRQLFGCDEQTGEVLWTYSYRKGGDTPAEFTYDAQTKQLIFPALWYMTASLDIQTGGFFWKNTEYPATLRNNTPLIHDGRIYGCGQNQVYSLELATGKLLHSRQMDFYLDSPGRGVIEGQTLYLGTSEKGVVALDKDTFEVLRFYPAGPAALLTAPYLYGPVQTVEGSPILDGDRLIFAGSDGYIRVYEKDTAQPLLSISIGAPCINTPLWDGEYLYTADFSGHISKFKL